MTNDVLVQMMVTPDIAKLLNQNGMAELAFRDSEARFEMFAKAIMIKNANNPNANEFGNQMLQAVANQNVQIKQVNHAWKGMGLDIKDLRQSFSKMANAAPAILKDVNVMKAVGFLNAGLAVVNIGVNVAGFIIISKQLNKLDSKLTDISEKLDRLNANEEDKLIQQCRQFRNEYFTISMKYQDKDPVLRDELTSLLNRMEPFMQRLITAMYKREFEVDHLFEMLYGILPCYFFLADKYMGSYYLEKGKLPDDMRNILSLYETLLSEQFNTFIFDYYFLEKKYNSVESLTLVNAHRLLAAKQIIYFYDREELLRALKTRKNIDKYDKAMNTYARKRMEDEMATFAEENNLNAKQQNQILKLAVSS